MKRTNIYTISVIIFIAIILLGFYLYKRGSEPNLLTYTNTTYGISFTYPDNYELTEHTVTEGQPGTIVTITDRGITMPENGEGPTAITVAMYDGAQATTTLPVWIKTSPYSNFSLARQAEPGVTQVAGQNGYLYTWDGLYQGTTVVTEHENNIIMFSVTYEGESDLEKRNVFTNLVAGTVFIEPGAATSTPQ
jgi:hypothetical protein